MTFEYISAEDAIARTGLRMVVVPNVPSPWGEAAKGILHIKDIEWAAVRLAYDDPALTKWAGEVSGPVAVYNNEAPRSGWAEILLMAERLAPTPSLIPKDSNERALMFGLSHEMLSEGGLAWERRVQVIHGSLGGDGGFPVTVAQYLAHKYGHTKEAGKAAAGRVHDLLDMFGARLNAQKVSGSDYYIGDTITALDIYSAVSMTLFNPLPEEQCAMNRHSRKTFSTVDAETAKHLDPILLTHRDMIYERHLELPLSL